MTTRGVRAWVLLALHLAAHVLAFPHESPQRPAREGRTHLGDAPTPSPAKRKLQESLHRRESAARPHKQAPQFMLDLFNTVSVVNRGPPRSQKDLLEGNIVRSFEDKGHPGETFHFFNLSSFSRDERMVKAELRWFRKRQKHYFQSFGPHVYKVDVYEVLESQTRPWRGNLISTRLVPLYTQGWEVFNLTHTVSKWISDRQQNNGILVVTTLPSGGWLQSAAERQATDQSAFLVVFSDDVRTAITGNRSKSHGEHGNRRRRAAPPVLRGRPQPCQRVPLFVDFEEIGWAGWIISPRGYNANHCRGSCPFPLGESLRATNHATVQSIMHALRLSANVDAPCCVPDKLQSISLLYFDEEENVVLKQYDDMVAVSCGCH